MTDLNLAATCTDGGGDRAFQGTIANVNDGDDSTKVQTNAFYDGSSTIHTAILKSDLGSALTVDGMGVKGSWNSGSGAIDPDWEVQWASSSSGPWTTVTGYSHTWDFPTTYAEMEFDAQSARYWRIVWAEAPGGYSPNLYVVTWSIFEGTPPDPPDPPPPPEPGVGVVFDPDDGVLD